MATSAPTSCAAALEEEAVPPDTSELVQNRFRDGSKPELASLQRSQQLEKQLADVNRQLVDQRTLAQEAQEYITELEATSIAETNRLETEVRELTEYTEEFETVSMTEFDRMADENSQLRAQLAAAKAGGGGA